MIGYIKLYNGEFELINNLDKKAVSQKYWSIKILNINYVIIKK